VTGTGKVRFERVVTEGEFRLDQGTWPVENNVWIVGDDREVVVIDAAHDAAAIDRQIAGRTVRAIVCTHAHNDHVNAAPDLARSTGAPVLLHPADQEVWQLVHPERQPDGSLADGQKIEVAGITLEVLHTPGHTPGAVCLFALELAVVFTGDTLFSGGPGATGRSYSDFPTIIDSIRERLLPLPDLTMVLTGHGSPTSIGAESPHIDEWIARGH
jgi:glyoxylase-like metal-dependent hydrolase (beta-lactamase superfamily II)